MLEKGSHVSIDAPAEVLQRVHCGLAALGGQNILHQAKWLKVCIVKLQSTILLCSPLYPPLSCLNSAIGTTGIRLV